MKKIKDKVKRTVKYWRISFKQASERDRLLLGAFTLMALVYVWWAMLAF
jgi:hypothetical protein